MGVLHNRGLAAAVAAVMVAVAIFIGVSSGPVAQTDAFYVADYANVLSPQAEQYIAEQSYALGGRTGARFFVVTVKNTGVRSLEKYFNSLIGAWKLNDRADVMLLLDIGGDGYWFTYGSDWQGVFDYIYGDMLDIYLEPDFATKRYEDGILNFYDAVCGELATGINTGSVDYYPPVETQAYAVYPQTNLAAVFAVIFVMLILLIFLSGRRRRYRRRSIFAPRRPRSFGYGFGYGYSLGRARRGSIWGPPPPPRRPAPPRRPPSSGGFFGSSGGFSGGGRSSGGSRGGFSGGGRSSGGSRGGFSGGGRSSGGSRGGFSGGGRSSGGSRGGFSGGGRGGRK